MYDEPLRADINMETLTITTGLEFDLDMWNDVWPTNRRLSGSPVISYAENVRTASEGKGKISRRASQAGTGGYQPEIYTEEDENLLGDFKEEWQLFVDGYDAKGVRIYDPVRGKTCHQCRFPPSPDLILIVLIKPGF